MIQYDDIIDILHRKNKILEKEVERLQASNDATIGGVCDHLILLGRSDISRRFFESNGPLDQRIMMVLTALSLSKHARLASREDAAEAAGGNQ